MEECTIELPAVHRWRVFDLVPTSRNVPLVAAAEDVHAPVSLRDSVFGIREESQGASEGRIIRTRRIRAPRRAPVRRIAVVIRSIQTATSRQQSNIASVLQR